MPIYEYECGLCHFRFERKQGFDEEPISVCPECQGETRRVIHSSPVIFKGSGFYVTDSRKADTPSLSEAVEKMPTEKKQKGKKKG
jgi:putative FmdB family regulatory protein